MKLGVNFIHRGHFWMAGEEVPNHLIPAWLARKHKIDEATAAMLREDVRLLRERRAKEKEVALEAAKRKLGLKTT
jgi:hypothetical protein